MVQTFLYFFPFQGKASSKVMTAEGEESDEEEEDDDVEEGEEESDSEDSGMS